MAKKETNKDGAAKSGTIKVRLVRGLLGAKGIHRLSVKALGLGKLNSVRELKGSGRPVNSEPDRAAVLAALESVSGVCIFPEKAATYFLARAKPDIYVKGGDYTLDTLNKDEHRAVEQAGGKIKIIPFVPGKSTTALLEKISKL